MLPRISPLGKSSAKEQIDNSIWLITDKLCNSRPQKTLATEKIQIGNGVLAYFFRSSENESITCDQAQVFNRIVQSFSMDGDDTYLETSNLLAQAKRTVCKDNLSDTVTSDSTEGFFTHPQTAILKLFGEQGSIDLNGSLDCPDATLHFELKRIQQENGSSLVDGE